MRNCSWSKTLHNESQRSEIKANAEQILKLFPKRDVKMVLILPWETRGTISISELVSLTLDTCGCGGPVGPTAAFSLCLLVVPEHKMPGSPCTMGAASWNNFHTAVVELCRALGAEAEFFPWSGEGWGD